MSKYAVRLYRSVGQEMRMEVEAESESQAIDRALLAEKSGRGEWEDVDSSAPEAEADEVVE